MRDLNEYYSGLPVSELTALASTASQLGFEIVDIAGFLDLVDEQSQEQRAAVASLSQRTAFVTSANEQVIDMIRTMSETAEETLASVSTSVASVRENGDHSQQIAEWVQNLNARTAHIEETVQAMRQDNSKITSIASQVNILAINAKIEAGRAGAAGRGFAVVAEAINDLSKRTQKAAADINTNIASLGEWLHKLSEEAKEISSSAERVLAEAQTIDKSLVEIETNAQSVQAQTTNIARESEGAQTALKEFDVGLSQIDATSAKAVDGIRTARDRIETLITGSESLVQGTVALGGQSEDGVFIDFVKSKAKQIGELFENALATNQINDQALFDRKYQPIPNTNPQQMMAGCTALTDKLLPPILESALELDPRVVFCAAVDINGYLPTHNKKFGQPQSSDPVWNMANCRNRRIFDDRVGLKAGRNLTPFLMQVYRRDMGGGEFVMMKDLSAPIYVNQRHWGGLRLAFKI